jgi:hypothetical protein
MRWVLCIAACSPNPVEQERRTAEEVDADEGERSRRLEREDDRGGNGGAVTKRCAGSPVERGVDRNPSKKKDDLKHGEFAEQPRENEYRKAEDGQNAIKDGEHRVKARVDEDSGDQAVPHDGEAEQRCKRGKEQRAKFTKGHCAPNRPLFGISSIRVLRGEDR